VVMVDEFPTGSPGNGPQEDPFDRWKLAQLVSVSLDTAISWLAKVA